MNSGSENSSSPGILVNRISQQWQTFLLAVSFLTRIPVPLAEGAFDRYQHAFVRYFPLVGAFQGLILWAVYSLFEKAGLSQSLSLLLMMIVSFRLTGAFHEDGLADVADGLGGAFERQRKIEIMKDSRLGTYGAVALWSALTLKLVLLIQMSQLASATHFQWLVWLVTAMGFSRITSLWVSWQIPYIGDTDKSKGTPKIHSLERTNILIILASAFLLMLWIPSPWFFLLSQMAISFFAAKYFQKQLGGYNGDCLGTAQQVSELSCYLFFILAEGSAALHGGLL